MKGLNMKGLNMKPLTAKTCIMPLKSAHKVRESALLDLVPQDLDSALAALPLVLI
jgi:hypothetical protein